MLFAKQNVEGINRIAQQLGFPREIVANFMIEMHEEMAVAFAVAINMVEQHFDKPEVWKLVYTYFGKTTKGICADDGPECEEYVQAIAQEELCKILGSISNNESLRYGSHHVTLDEAKSRLTFQGCRWWEGQMALPMVLLVSPQPNGGVTGRYPARHVVRSEATEYAGLLPRGGYVTLYSSLFSHMGLSLLKDMEISPGSSLDAALQSPTSVLVREIMHLQGSDVFALDWQINRDGLQAQQVESLTQPLKEQLDEHGHIKCYGTESCRLFAEIKGELLYSMRNAETLSIFVSCLYLMFIHGNFDFSGAQIGDRDHDNDWMESFRAEIEPILPYDGLEQCLECDWSEAGGSDVKHDCWDE